LSLSALRDLYVKAYSTAIYGDVAAKTAGSITLSTFLRIKGMERDLVILGDASEDKVPLRADLTNPLEDTRELAIRERDLWYVAVTRARQSVIALYHASKQPSRFVELMRGTKIKPEDNAPEPEPTMPVAIRPPKTAPTRNRNCGESRAPFKALVARLNERN
jgi:hypothetical protein